jgi:hypothetical protein
LATVLTTLSRLLGLLTGLLARLLITVLAALSRLLSLLAGLAATLLPALMLRIGVFRIIGHKDHSLGNMPNNRMRVSRICSYFSRSAVAARNCGGPRVQADVRLPYRVPPHATRMFRENGKKR